MTDADLDRQLRAGLRDGAPVRLDLAGGGVVFVDHAVPLLVVYRHAPSVQDDVARDAQAAADRLVTTQPAYVITAEADPERAAATVRTVVAALADAAGEVLTVEVWAPLEDAQAEGVDPFGRAPGFTIYTGHGTAPETVDALCDALSGIEVAGHGASVDHVVTSEPAPPGLPPLGPGVIGLAVDAVFHNARDGEFYPRVLRRVRKALSPALRRAAVTATGAAPADLGRQSLEPAALAVDQGLSDVAGSFGFLLQVTPVNSDQAWEDFQGARCDQAPELIYRPLTFDPDQARRDLFALPLEKVEDPVVAGILRESRDEIGAQIQMILDVETPQFLPASARVYGVPDDGLVELAHQLIAVLDERPEATTGEEVVGATAFAAAARADLEHYHALSADVPTEIEIRDDITASLMVSRGQLLVGSSAQIPASRVAALLAHEVGTHVLTYANGCAQPLGLLHHGLAGYQDLQEGLAVLGEWLVGGLTAGRFRILAARVIGARALAGGSEFVETFRTIREHTGLSDRAAFGVALRLHRGGGLTKDMVYLRGLRDLLAHLAQTDDAQTGYWPLFIGKIALRHLPAVETLRQRGVLRDAPLLPRYASDPAALARLAAAQRGLSVTDLL